jgi:hypothetical protein
LSVPDEGYSNLLELSVPDEGYSNLLELSVPDEGYSVLMVILQQWDLILLQVSISI